MSTTMTLRRTTALASVAALVALGACGSDDSDDESAGAADDAAEVASEGSDESSGEGAGTTGQCAETDVAYVGPDGEVSIASTGAVSIQDGAAYTVYLSDGEIDLDSVSMVSNPEVGDEETLITVAITIFNAEGEVEPIEVGEQIPYTDEFGVLTYRVTSQKGDDLAGNNLDASGVVSITAVGDELCFEVDYTDGEKSLTGKVKAEVKDL